MTWRDRGALRIREAAEVLAVSPSHLRRQIRAERVPTISVLGQTRIPVAWIREQVGEESREADERIPDALEREVDDFARSMGL